jgi:aryl-alcohol dehydrogenase-like predicted oxidoreductase
MFVAQGLTGLKVSPLGLGVTTFGWGANKRAAREIFNLYREHGGNFFDTVLALQVRIKS